MLDPIFSLTRCVRLAPGATARIAFWTLVAPSREEVLDLVDQHRDPPAFERAATLAWTQGQVELHHLGIAPDEAVLFQRLAGHLLYNDPALRPSSDVLRRRNGGQQALWAHGISGDLPIVLVRIDDTDDLGIVRQVLRAFEYWRLKQLNVDVVILNERSSSYVQDLQSALETLTRAGLSRVKIHGESVRGGVFVLRSDIIPSETRLALLAAAGAVLLSRHGSLAEQLDRLEQDPPQRRRRSPPADAPRIDGASLDVPTLEFFNGLGGFTADGEEYVTVLRDGQRTPAPWINVIANAGFGFQVSADGSGCTWAGNSRENRLTPWSNDPVGDRSGEVFYVRDDDTGLLFGPTALPVRNAGGEYLARHGRGYSRFEHARAGIALDLLQFVPGDESIKVSRLRIRNLSGRTRHLTLTAYVEWVLGTSRSGTAPFVATEIDPVTGGMLARNLWGGMPTVVWRSRTWRAADCVDRQPDGIHRTQRHARAAGRPCGRRGALGANRRWPRPLRRIAGLRRAGGERDRRSRLAAGRGRQHAGGPGHDRALAHRGRGCRAAIRARELERRAGHSHGPHTGPRLRSHAERLAAVPDARVPALGAQRVLPGERRLRLPRSAAGHDGAAAGAARPRARAPAARCRPAVPRRRRAALVVAANGTRSAHPRLR